MVLQRTSAWQPNTIYSINDQVFYGTETYKCITNHTSGLNFNKTYWIKVGDEKKTERIITDHTLDNETKIYELDCSTDAITLTLPDASTLQTDLRYIQRVDTNYGKTCTIELANPNDSLYGSAYDHTTLDAQGQGIMVFLTSEGKYMFANLSGVAGDLPMPVLFYDGFEDGNLNNWNVVNDGTNNWIVGTADRYEGTYSAYISNDGTNPTYTNNVAQVSHIYVDVSVPANVNDLILKFKWKGQGEVNYDFMKVYLVGTGTTPTAGSQLSSSDQIGASQYNNSTTRQEEEIHLGSTYNGSTVRFVFSWRNDGSVGSDSIRIDEVEIGYIPN